MMNFTEKRKYPRIDTHLSLRYKELHGNSYLSKRVLTKNLSFSGVRFSADRFIALSSPLVLEIKLPSTPKWLKIISKVAWIKKISDGEEYDVGNYFLAMASKDESTISNYLENTLKAI